MMTPEERYLRDPEFHMLVDVILGWVIRCHYTPTEVREAAMLAAIKYETEHRPHFTSALEQAERKGK